MVTGFGNGAPATSCVNLSPTHAGITKQSAATNKYSLSVEEIDGAMNTRKDQPVIDYISVCVKGAKFQGILMQVRVVGKTEPVGTFDAKLPNNTKRMKCTADGDSVSHSKAEDKADPTCFTWKFHDTTTTEKLHAV
ncbi:hypothetical protein NP493_5g15019 [Ridgeia piscesae]|uniref:Reelin domain-containing protein n=1 Tax=Ridgeia piscesae TaxID=27915 RepID=A0AAD9PFP5_RIDPI|nr:hypothetical protein NP493_5g15019 [Ridgeia piscesae]